MRRAPLLLLLLLASCKTVSQVEDMPSVRREEPAQQLDEACPARAPLKHGECRAKTDCLNACVRDVERRIYGDCSCPAGEVCERWSGGTGVRQACRSACQRQTAPPGAPRPGCLADERCEDSGRCAPLLCGQDYTCPAGMSCTPGEHGADLHGCSGAPCSADKDCPCPSYCVMGQCQGSAGRCESPRG